MKATIYRSRRGLFSRPQWRARIVHTDKNGRPGKTFLETSESYNNPGDIARHLATLNPGLEIVTEG